MNIENKNKNKNKKTSQQHQRCYPVLQTQKPTKYPAESPIQVHEPPSFGGGVQRVIQREIEKGGVEGRGDGKFKEDEEWMGVCLGAFAYIPLSAFAENLVQPG